MAKRTGLMCSNGCLNGRAVTPRTLESTFFQEKLATLLMVRKVYIVYRAMGRQPKPIHICGTRVIAVAFFAQRAFNVYDTDEQVTLI